MKKLCFTLAAILLAGTLAKAQTFTLVEGNLDFLKEVAELQVELTWNGTLIGKMTEQEYVDSKKENKADFEDFQNKWYGDDRMVSELVLRNSFGKSLGKRSSVTIDQSARYKFVFNVDKIDLGFAGVGLVSKGSQVWATVNVVDVTTGETLAVFQVDKCKSITQYDMKATKVLIFDKLGNTTAKWLVKRKYVKK